MPFVLLLLLLSLKLLLFLCHAYRSFACQFRLLSIHRSSLSSPLSSLVCMLSLKLSKTPACSLVRPFALNRSIKRAEDVAIGNNHHHLLLLLMFMLIFVAHTLSHAIVYFIPCRHAFHLENSKRCVF